MVCMSCIWCLRIQVTSTGPGPPRCYAHECSQGQLEISVYDSEVWQEEQPQHHQGSASDEHGKAGVHCEICICRQHHDNSDNTYFVGGWGGLARWDGRHHTTPKSRVRAPVSSQVLGQPSCPSSDIKGGGGRVLL